LRSQLSENDRNHEFGYYQPLTYTSYLGKTYFHIFLPITEQKEVDTELILHLLSGKDKEIIISKAFDSR
jgi:5-formyltetrahydrofolate cyclo-ligase